MQLADEDKLKIKSSLLSEEEMRSPLFKGYIKEMLKVMQELFATGITANQIGWAKKVIIIGAKDLSRYDIFINASYKPIKKHGTYNSIEGSISFPKKQFSLTRWNTIKVTYSGIINNRWQTFCKKFRLESNLQQLIDLTDGISLKNKGSYFGEYLPDIDIPSKTYLKYYGEDLNG